MFGNGSPFSYSRGFPQEDFPQQRRPFQQDEPKESPLQRNGISRPSGRFIYMQRKEYSEVLNKQPDNFQARVEHLFTWELDGREVRTVEDCVAKLIKLDANGRLWPQEMIMELKEAYLLLSDIETKSELETLPLMSILQTKAVLESCAYNSLLALTVQERSKHFPQVFLFQCEETGAELIKTDLDKALQRGGGRGGGGGGGGGDLNSHREPTDIMINLDRYNPGSFRQPGPRPMEQEETLPPPDYAQRMRRDPSTRRAGDYMPPQPAYSPPGDVRQHPNVREMESGPQMAPEGSDSERNMEILNHVIDDLEIFMGKIGAAGHAPSQQNKKKKNAMKKRNASSLPHWDEYVSCLQKIKYGFNLLAELNGVLANPDAPEFVHIFVTNLGMIAPLYPADLPPTVVSPLLTPQALTLLNETLTMDEKRLYRSLGDCWTIPRSSWPDENVPPYIPVFYDGWQPPAPSHALPAFPRQNEPISRNNFQRLPSTRPGGPRNDSQRYSPQPMQRQPEEMPATNGPWSSPPPVRPTEPPLYMRVIYNFMARNSQELTVMKDEVVQVVQKSRPWWLVRNSRNEEGSVPPNVLESLDNSESTEYQQWDSRSPPTLNMNSSPADVKAWLEYKGFSRITVSSLGVLRGQQLLGMSKEEIRTVCPEDAGKVFFNLQAVKSSLALASEPSGMYDSRY
ncbi:epidermal growth factor receptor kinase substrate 8-like protein 3b [Kryptolebias marmoratus]|uniref:EPS8 signaling adaptor L3b n=1 Tax=Kryptolebias marmoratus TaxID=37003 RepID=A0A3Q3GHF3_KRYMA|nr:epidermal growth factor receptor kinase substrate 8-like protein 3b [Kryptolebias marmoratus]